MVKGCGLLGLTFTDKACGLLRLAFTLKAFGSGFGVAVTERLYPEPHPNLAISLALGFTVSRLRGKRLWLSLGSPELFSSLRLQAGAFERDD